MAAPDSDYISKHTKYIDTRIDELLRYVSSKRAPDIESLMELLLDNSREAPSSQQGEHPTALHELRDLIASWDLLRHGDLPGYIYQRLRSRDYKKRHGQYFTPRGIVDFILKNSLRHLDTTPARVLDPSCGSGQFLMAAARLLFEEQDPRAGAKKSLAEIVRRSIFGFDSDPMAAAIARFNLAKLSGCHPDEVNVHAVDFLDRDDLGLSAGTAGPQPFDLITGNPPWGSAIAREKKRYYHNNYFSAHSGINTFTLFMERAFDVIAPGGLVSFLIPEAYLNIKAHCNSRLHLLDSARVCNIALWGEQFRGVFAPSVSIIARQESSAEKRYSSIVEIHRAKSGPDIAAMVPQNSFHRHPEFIFNVNYSRKAAGIIDSIENRDCFYLKGRAKFFLGIVTGNNALHISTTRTDDHPDAIITGRDVNQYTLSFSGHYFNYNRESLQQVAPRALYTTPNKVLYRFIGRRLTFALDREGLYSLNNVNGFIPQFDCINIESILSVLNSSVLQYYYEKNFFTVKVLRGNLEKLPIRMIGRENQKKLARLAGQILQSEEGRCALERETIEDIIFHEYGIRDRQAHHITEYLAQPPSDI